MNEREKRLESCKICVNKKFSPKQGIICSLTKKQADFIEVCNDLKIDPEAQRYHNNSKELAKESKNFGRRFLTPWNLIIPGFILLALSIFNFIIDYFTLKTIDPFEIIHIIGAGVLLFFGFRMKKNKSTKNNAHQEDILDS